MAQWFKHMCALFVDASGVSGPNWVRVGKSTVFSISFNPQVETTDYIEDEYPTDIIRRYNPSLDQHIAMIEGDPAFDALFAMRKNLPTGTDAHRRILVVYPKNGANGKVSFTGTGTITFTSEQFVNGRLTFTIGSVRDIVWGETTFSSGAPAFIPES